MKNINPMRDLRFKVTFDHIEHAWSWWDRLTKNFMVCPYCGQLLGWRWKWGDQPYRYFKVQSFFNPHRHGADACCSTNLTDGGTNVMFFREPVSRLITEIRRLLHTTVHRSV